MGDGVEYRPRSGPASCSARPRRRGDRMPALVTRMQSAALIASAMVRSSGRRLRDFAAQLGSRKRPIASALTWPRPLSNMRSAGSELTGGLFRKYAVFLVALVGGFLVINALVEIYSRCCHGRQALSTEAG